MEGFYWMDVKAKWCKSLHNTQFPFPQKGTESCSSHMLCVSDVTSTQNKHRLVMGSKIVRVTLHVVSTTPLPALCIRLSAAFLCTYVGKIDNSCFHFLTIKAWQTYLTSAQYTSSVTCRIGLQAFRILYWV